MTKANDQHAEANDEAGDRFSAELETLKKSFGQLREDVTQLLHSAASAGKHGAGALKARASNAVANAGNRIEDRVVAVKDCGVESVERLGQRIGERPLLSTAIAVGVGFVLARALLPRR